MRIKSEDIKSIKGGMELFNEPIKKEEIKKRRMVLNRQVWRTKQKSPVLSTSATKSEDI